MEYSLNGVWQLRFNDPAKGETEILVHVSLESKNSLDLNKVRNNVKMVRF